MNCQNCGKKVDSNAKFCSECGSPISINNATNNLSGDFKQITSSKKITISDLLSNIIFYVSLVISLVFLYDWIVNYGLSIDGPLHDDSYIGITRIIIGFLGYIISFIFLMRILAETGFLTIIIIGSLGHALCVFFGFIVGYIGPFILGYLYRIYRD